MSGFLHTKYQGGLPVKPLLKFHYYYLGEVFLTY